MKNIIKFLLRVVLFIIEIPSRLHKMNFIAMAELKLAETEYKHMLDKSEKTAKDIRDCKRLIKAMKKCPPIILVNQLRTLTSFEKDEITEDMCEVLLKRIELYSAFND